MWNFKIKGFLTLIFLCCTANTEKILDPEEHYYPINGSIYDRLMNSPAAKDEKDTVMGSLKSILAHIPDPSNWTSFTEVIREGKLEENIEKLGGEKSKNAVYFLQTTLKTSRNKTALTGFLEACLEFLSLEKVSKTEKMLIMADFLTSSEYSSWYKGSAKLAEVMGVKKVFVFPQNQIDFLVKYWNKNPILNDSILSDKLEKLSKIMQDRELFMTNLVQLLQNFKDSDSEESKVLTKFQNWTEIDSSLLFNGIDQIFKDLLDTRLLDFNFTLIETIEYNLMEHPDFETILMSQLEKEQVKNYFTRIDKKHRAHVLINYATFFIPMVKSYTKSQLDAVSELLKEYTSLKNSNKVSFGKVLTKNTTRYACWDLWKSQEVSTEIEKMVKLVKVFEKEFGIKTCFSKIIDIRDIAQLSEYWDRYYAHGLDELTALLSVNQTFKDTLQAILTDTKTPSRSSYRHILKTVRGVIKDHSKPFKDFFHDIWMIHGSDYEPLWMAMKQFFEYSEDQRKNYNDLHFADSNSSLAQFFKAIQPSSADDYDVSLLKPYDQWNTKQMDGIYNVVRETWFMEYKLTDKKNQRILETVESVLEENVSYKECEFAWNFMKDDEFAKKIRKVIGYLDDTFGKMSCETEPPVVFPDDLPF
ncbi:unnamed protein product [Caenorhabditis brenneri]